MELRESRVPLFGNGLFANHDLSWPVIFVRIALAGAFLVMNLGIDGIEEPKFEPVSLHSKVVAGGGGCNNRSTGFIGWTLNKCTRYSLDRQTFNVTLPVFNLTEIEDKPNKYLVNQTTVYCNDGKDMKEEKVLVKGRWLRSLIFRRDIGLRGKVYLEPENSTLGPEEPRYYLGSTVLPYGKVYELSKVIHVKTKEALLSDGTLTAYCSPRATVNITEKDGRPPRLGQTHLCYFLYKLRSSSYLFNGIINKLYANELGIGAKIRFSDAVVFDEGIDFNSDIFESIAYDYLLAGEGSQGILTAVLGCHFDAAINGKEKRYEIINGDVKVTKINLVSFAIGCSVVAFAVLLTIFFVSTSLFCGRITDNMQVNTLDGLSRILSNTSSSTRDGNFAPNNRARVRYSNTIQVTSANYNWTNESSMDRPYSADYNWENQLRMDHPHSP